MFTTILTFITIPAEFISRVFDNVIVMSIVTYILKICMFLVILIPVFTEVTFADTISTVVGTPFTIVYETIPTFFSQSIITAFGDKFHLLATISVICYWLVVSVSILLSFFKIFENVIKPPPVPITVPITPKEMSDQLEYDRRSAATWASVFDGSANDRLDAVKHHDGRYSAFTNIASKHDSNDSMLFHGLTTLKDVQDAEVQANAIAKALQNR